MLIMIKCGEIVLKGLNRHRFEETLMKNIKHRMRDLGKVRLRCAQSTIYLESDDADIDIMFERLRYVFGISNISKVHNAPKDIDEICRLALKLTEERKNGTEQLILTSPRSLTSIVLGKFIAAAIIMFITELFTLMYFAILSYFGKPSIVVAASTLLGFFLLSLAYISFGMFASSITENQIVACVVTIFAFIFINCYCF